MTQTIRVLLADDSVFVRKGLVRSLGRQRGILIVGEAGDHHAARRLSLDLKPDVLMLDLGMPGPPARENVVYLRKHCPEMKILAFSGYDDDAYIRALVTAGVSGYVLKPEEPEAIACALRTVTQGDTWFSEPLIEKLEQDGIADGPLDEGAQ